MNLIDFLIGALLMNAMPHFVIGITKTRFLGLFGYSPAGNIAYAVFQIVISLGLFIYQYGFKAIVENKIYLGALVVILLYLLCGRFMVKKFENK